MMGSCELQALSYKRRPSSFPRRRESRNGVALTNWIPAYAGMTGLAVAGLRRTILQLIAARCPLPAARCPLTAARLPLAACRLPLMALQSFPAPPSSSFPRRRESKPGVTPTNWIPAYAEMTGLAA